MHPAPMPQIAAVVLNWNNYQDSRDCLLSLQQATYPRLRVVLVDNGSSDGSGEQLAAEFPGADFMSNTTNLGFARGCNVGTRHALAHGADYVLLLNNDTVVTAGFLEPAVATAEADPRV